MIIEFFMAASFSVCWQNPSENVDGSILDNLTRVRVHYELTSDTSINGNIPFDTDEEGAERCESIDVPQAGEYEVFARAINLLGEVSADSNHVMKMAVEDANPPAPPIILQQEATVFTVVKQPDRFVLLPIGTVPAGTECSQVEFVNGHGVVPNAAVQWTSDTGPRPVVVVAQCDG